MKIINQSHEIISLPDNPLELIELAGRTCYKSEDRIGCTIPEEHQGPENCPESQWVGDEVLECNSRCQCHSSRKFVQILQNRGHHAMIEFADLTVKFITNRGVTHELVRHRMCSFAQESTRYVKYAGEMEFILPVWMDRVYLGEWDKERVLSLNDDESTHDVMCFMASLDLAQKSYSRLVNAGGWRPEQAREVLPNALKTEIVVKANLREWHHVLTLRTSKAAHPQMRALMLPLLEELKTKISVIFDDILI